MAKKKKLKTFTVIGVYNSGDAECIGERFADSVQAVSWQDAEAQVNAARNTDSILIAGVLEGDHHCVDVQ